MQEMKVNSITGKEVMTIKLPEQFNEDVRKDLIKRAFNALRSHKIQPQGVMKGAGNRWAVYLSKRRRAYKTVYGAGRSRTPRKTLSSRGRRFMLVGAMAPFTVKGRVAHPPKSEKKIKEKINKKERRKAIRSALSACKPVIIENKMESIKQTKELIKALNKNGLKLEKVVRRKAGKGKMRGRIKRYKKGPLLVFNDKCDAIKASNNIPGVNAAIIKELNIELLAPGGSPGRTAVFSLGAIKRIGEEKLWM